jgi:hypothetical protein
MRDAKLFGRAFHEPSWALWLAIARARDALPPLDGDAALFATVSGGAPWPTEPVSELYVAAGRRSGKTQFSCAAAVHAAFIDYRKRMTFGEVAVVALIACDRAQAREAFNRCVGLIEQSPILKREVVRQDAESITLKHRVRLEVHVPNFRSARGYTIAAAICDEMSFWRSEDSALPDVEVVRALRPALSTLGGRLIGISSPHARRGHLYEMHRRYFGRPA